MIEVEEQLRRHARWVRPQMAPIELPRDGVVVLPPASPSRPPGRRAWLIVAAAAALVAVLTSIGVVASRTDRHRPAPTGPVTSVTATGPQSALVPTWIPRGLRLVRLDTERPGEIPYPHDLATGPYATQLFGTHGQPLVEIKIEPTYGQIVSWGGANTTVRGQPANNSAEVHPNRRLRWIERGALVTVTAKPSFAGQLRAFLAGLRWAGLKPTDGFVAPVLTQLAPTYLAADGGAGLNTSLVYALNPSSDRQLDIITCPDGIGDCSGMTFDNYLDVWFNGHRDADGSATYSRYSRDGFGSFVRAWPHGGGVDVETDGQPLDRAQMQRLVAGLRVVDVAGLDALRATITHQALELPPLASSHLQGGRLELRGTRDGPWALCVEMPRQPVICSRIAAPVSTTPLTLDHGVRVYPAAYRELDLGFLAEGHWIAGAVTVRAGATLSFPILENGEIPGPAVNSPASTASVTVGNTTYHFGLAQPPDSAYSIGIVENTSSGSASGGADRPGF
jgi:hypothetical protein